MGEDPDFIVRATAAQRYYEMYLSGDMEMEEIAFAIWDELGLSEGERQQYIDDAHANLSLNS